MTRIYTRSGDDGTTALGGGRRVQKDAARVEAYGTVDELNAITGNVVSHGPASEIQRMLNRIQNDLFQLGADLAFPQNKGTITEYRIQEHHIKQLEAFIDELSKTLKPLENFILPGGSITASNLHVARTICRKAERRVVALDREVKQNPAVKYLNRLSDLLFVMARFQNKEDGVLESKWIPEKED